MCLRWTGLTLGPLVSAVAVLVLQAARCILRLADILDHSQAAASKAAAGIGPENPMSKIFSREQQLQQRAWLLHWAMWLLLRYYLLLTYAKGQSCRNQAWSALLDWVVQER